jgi:hypothetical protein
MPAGNAAHLNYCRAADDACERVWFSGEHVNEQQSPPVCRCRLTQELHLHIQEAGAEAEWATTIVGNLLRPPCCFSRPQLLLLFSPSLYSIAARAQSTLWPRHPPRDPENHPRRSGSHPRANPQESGVRGVCGQVRFLGSKTAALTSPTPPAGRRVFNIVALPRALARETRGRRHALS